MKKADVFMHGLPAGVLTADGKSWYFDYLPEYSSVLVVVLKPTPIILLNEKK